MPVLVPAAGQQLAVNGVDLSAYAVIADSLAPLMATPAKRGKNVVVPGRHGAIHTPRKRFDEADFVLKLWVMGANPDGTVPAGQAAQKLYANADTLLEVFSADTVLLTRTMPDGTVRQAVAEVLAVMDWTRSLGDRPLLGQVRVAVTVPGAFWLDQSPVSQTITGTTGVTATLSAFAAATAPMSDLALTFYGPISNPQLMLASGRYVQWNGVITSGQQLVLNTATWLPTSGLGTAWSPDLRNVSFGPGPSWLELDPSGGAATLTHTGGGSASVQISGRRAYLSA